VERHLGGRGVKPILYSTVVGTALPICCIGSLPIAVSLYQKGARLGPVLAFLVATPATSITALLVTYALLGLKFTMFIFFAVIVMGLVMGLVGNLIKVRPRASAPRGQQAIDPVCGMSIEVGKAAKAEYGGEVYYFCCSHCQQAFESRPEEYAGAHSRNFTHRLKHVFKYAFADMVKEIGPELLLGLALAALVAAIAPVREICRKLSRWRIRVSLQPRHLCLLHGQRSLSGCSCITGDEHCCYDGASASRPDCQLGDYLGFGERFGGKTLLTYLVVVSIMALALGYCFSMI